MGLYRIRYIEQQESLKQVFIKASSATEAVLQFLRRKQESVTVFDVASIPTLKSCKSKHYLTISGNTITYSHLFDAFKKAYELLC